MFDSRYCFSGGAAVIPKPGEPVPPPRLKASAQRPTVAAPAAPTPTVPNDEVLGLSLSSVYGARRMPVPNEATQDQADEDMPDPHSIYTRRTTDAE